jgi:hypothetical protein
MSSSFELPDFDPVAAQIAVLNFVVGKLSTRPLKGILEIPNVEFKPDDNVCHFLPQRSPIRTTTLYKSRIDPSRKLHTYLLPQAPRLSS